MLPDYSSIVSDRWKDGSHTWSIINKHESLLFDKYFYLTSPDILRFGELLQLENNSYRIKFPIDFAELNL